MRDRAHYRAGDLRDQVQLQQLVDRNTPQGRYRGYEDVADGEVWAQIDFRPGSSSVRQSGEVTEYGGKIVFRTRDDLDIDGSWRVVVRSGPWAGRRFKVDGVDHEGWRHEWTELDVSQVK